MKKMLLFLLVATFLAVPAFAGNVPEYDTVGCDATNVFARNNLAQHVRVALNNKAWLSTHWKLINFYSDWSDFGCATPPCGGSDVYIPPRETFTPDGTTQAQLDPCFYDEPYKDDIFDGFTSYASLTGHSSTWEWVIVLQMMPESDIDVNVYDCVLKPDCEPFEMQKEKRQRVFGRRPYEYVEVPQALWHCANETGFFRNGQNGLFFAPGALPEITVEAITLDGREFALDARAPRVRPNDVLSNKSFISKAIWDEGIVAELPEVGILNGAGQTEDMLMGGDQIRVTISVPAAHPNEIRYGADSVILKYIGVIEGWYLDTEPCVSHPCGQFYELDVQG